MDLRLPARDSVLMFRNNQLLQRSNQIGTGDRQDVCPVAILADPYEAEAGILVPVLRKFGLNVLESRDESVALALVRETVKEVRSVPPMETEPIEGNNFQRR
jgi:hypothetical protein